MLLNFFFMLRLPPISTKHPGFHTTLSDKTWPAIAFHLAERQFASLRPPFMSGRVYTTERESNSTSGVAQNLRCSHHQRLACPSAPNFDMKHIGVSFENDQLLAQVSTSMHP